jgi:hypothetical protein
MREQNVLPVLFTGDNNCGIPFRGSVFKQRQSQIGAGVFYAVLVDENGAAILSKIVVVRIRQGSINGYVEKEGLRLSLGI